VSASRVRLGLAIAAAGIAACRSSAYVVVTVSGDLSGVQQLEIDASDGSNTRQLFAPPVPRSLALPQSLTLEVPSSWSRPLTLSLIALGPGAVPLGQGGVSGVDSAAVQVILTALSAGLTTGGQSGAAVMVTYANGGHCATSADCNSGICVAGVCCNATCSGACMTCSAPGAIGTCEARPAGTSAGGGCPDQGAVSCGLDGTCDGRGACRSYVAGTVCFKGTCSGDGAAVVGVRTCDGVGACQPSATLVCAPYGCDPTTGACYDACTEASQCVSGRSCINASCGEKMKGASCADNSDCESGFCADGTCCNVACQGGCVSCALPGRLGTCWPVDPGVPDPRAVCRDQGPASCGMDGLCDGLGACRLYPADTVCIPPSCSGTQRNNPGTCDGLGACRRQGAVDCSPYGCVGAECTLNCAGDSDCLAPNVCRNGSCGPRPLGAACASGLQCGSGICADAVCCNQECGGPCQSCTLPAAMGTCSPVPAGGADPHGFCQPSAAATCGTTGLCDGAGACALYGTGTICSGASEGGAPTTCDGKGDCGGGDAGMSPTCGVGADASEAGACPSPDAPGQGEPSDASDALGPG
jgi:hypothetical protein